MLLRGLRLAGFVLALACLTGGGAAAQENPVSWSAKAAAKGLRPGGNFDVTITGLAEEEWHVYSVTQPGIAVLLTSGYARELIPAEDRPDYPLIAKPYRGEELMARLRSVRAARRPGVSVLVSFLEQTANISMPCLVSSGAVSSPRGTLSRTLRRPSGRSAEERMT